MVYYGSKLMIDKKIFTAIKTYLVHTILSKFCQLQKSVSVNRIRREAFFIIFHENFKSHYEFFETHDEY